MPKSKKVPQVPNFWAPHHTLFVLAIFLISTLILPYFCKNRDHFAGGTPNQRLLNDPPDDYYITLSLSGHFHPLIFDTFGQKYLFMDPGTLLDGTPNLEWALWMIRRPPVHLLCHYYLLSTCPPIVITIFCPHIFIYCFHLLFYCYGHLLPPATRQTDGPPVPLFPPPPSASLGTCWCL